MYGMIVKMTAKAGQRDALAAAMLGEGEVMPGCLSFVVANDPTHPEGLWITEVWASKDAHAASMEMPAVKESMRKGMPLIAGMEIVAETNPVGGIGLAMEV